MPTASEASFEEARRWSDLADRWVRDRRADVWDDRPPTEKAVVVFFDPIEDLTSKARRSGHDLEDDSLPALARFAAQLADGEGRHWSAGEADLATRAYELRRFLIGDRLAHWAVPWLDAVGRCYPATREEAHADRDFILAVADEMRIEPAISGRVGLVVEGEDSFGPLETPHELDTWLNSLWSGHLILRATWTSLTADRFAPPLDELALLYEVAGHRWRGMAEQHPGSAQIWLDLSARAGRTVEMLEGSADSSKPNGGLQRS